MCLPFALCALTWTQTPVTAVVGGTIFDGTGGALIEDGVILMSGERITAAGTRERVTIPPDATRIDAAGRTIIPGLINTQAHISAHTRSEVEAQLRLYARYGVTSVFSPDGVSPPAVMLREEPAQGRARLFRSGATLNNGSMDEAKALLAGGASFLPRNVRDRPVDFEFVQLARSRDACVASSLVRELSTFVYESTPSFFRDTFFLRYADREMVERLSNREYQDEVRNNPDLPRDKAAFEQARRNVKQLQDAGVRITSGTGSGAPARFPGSFEHLELELMVDAGLTPLQALVAATRDAARCMAQDAIGTIRPGSFADLIVLDRSPFLDIRNTRRIESVWVSGVQVDTGR